VYIVFRQDIWWQSGSGIFQTATLNHIPLIRLYLMALSLLLPFVTIAVTVMSIWQKAVLISSADWAAQEIDMRGSNVVVKVAALTEQCGFNAYLGTALP